MIHSFGSSNRGSGFHSGWQNGKDRVLLNLWRKLSDDCVAVFYVSLDPQDFMFRTEESEMQSNFMETNKTTNLLGKHLLKWSLTF